MTSKITFGKHKGTPISDIPTDYLRWLVEEANNPGPMLHEFMRELERRKTEEYYE